MNFSVFVMQFCESVYLSRMHVHNRVDSQVAMLRRSFEGAFYCCACPPTDWPSGIVYSSRRAYDSSRGLSTIITSEKVAGRKHFQYFTSKKMSENRPSLSGGRDKLSREEEKTVAAAPI